MSNDLTGVFGRLNSQGSPDLFSQVFMACMQHRCFKEGKLDVSISTIRPRGWTPGSLQKIPGDPMLEIKNRETNKALFMAVGPDGSLKISRKKFVGYGLIPGDSTAMLGEIRLTEFGAMSIRCAIDGISEPEAGRVFPDVYGLHAAPPPSGRQPKNLDQHH